MRNGVIYDSDEECVYLEDDTGEKLALVNFDEYTVDGQMKY